MKYPRARLLIFSKAPEPGAVKTRLIPVLGAEGAARLYAGLLDSCIEKSAAARLCPVTLCCSPSASHAHFRQLEQRFGVDLVEQAGGDLGARMSQALYFALEESSPVLLAGADCPALSAADLETGLEQLEAGSDVVLGPATDGGYYLIGMQTHHAGLFDAIPWGTAAVLEQTRQRIRDAGLSCHELPPHTDLDTPADYRAWLAAQAGSG